MGDNTQRVLNAVIFGASGALIALAGSGLASADPIAPAPPAPSPVAAPGPAPAPLAAESAPESAPVSAAAGEAPQAPQAEGVPHLPSPDALPPGSTMDPTVQGNEGPNVSYLKDLWHAVQNQEISGKEALIMGLAQRGMNTPYPEQSAGPNVPISPGLATDPALAPPPPASPLPPTP